MAKEVQGVVAIACEKELRTGLMAAMPKAIYAIPNKRPYGYCVDTDVYMEDVLKAIEFFVKSYRKTHDKPALKKKTVAKKTPTTKKKTVAKKTPTAKKKTVAKKTPTTKKKTVAKKTPTAKKKTVAKKTPTAKKKTVAKKTPTTKKKTVTRKAPKSL
ncbi:S6 sporozoite-induced protein [Candidatus Scalindua japonica]|uniref:S6 sporozoite-induced protein n=2 Tax=Candidatus Scalindua japonica TaxID=1284222 RepID=A0A286U3M4_9BACT|nr:S6 sporozoite-induced protein [Candidatus Scalindua japonica]